MITNGISLNQPPQEQRKNSVYNTATAIFSSTTSYCPEVYRALDGVRYIAECTKQEEESNKVSRGKFMFSPIRKYSFPVLGLPIQYVLYISGGEGPRWVQLLGACMGGGGN